MPIDRSKIRKGALMFSTPVPEGHVVRRRNDDEKLLREFPEFEETIKAAGPSHGPMFEAEKAAIRELSRRLEILRFQMRKARGK